MIFRFAILFLTLLFVGAAIVSYDDNSRPAPIETQLFERPSRAWPWSRYAGFCYVRDTLGNTYTRGDLFLWGQNRGPRKRPRIQIRGALYLLRGEADTKATLTVDGGRGFQTIRSQELSLRPGWRKVTWRGRLPRFARKGSAGQFTFEFQGSLLDQSCSWDFTF